MKEHQAFIQHTKRWLLRAMMGFIAIELLMLFSILLTDDQQQLTEMKTAISESLDTPPLTAHIERYESFRVGPYTRTRLVFFEHDQQKISAVFHQWFNFTPSLSCVSTDPRQPCQ